MNLEDLIVDVNEVVQWPDLTSLYRPCARYIKTVYGKIGVRNIFSGVTTLVDVRNGIAMIPDDCYRVMDVGDEDQHGLIETNMSYQFKSIYSYRVNGEKIYVDSSRKKITLSYQRLPVDDNGTIVIQDQMYDAVLNYCIGQELLKKSSNVKQFQNTLNPALAYQQNARTMIDQARAFYNESRPGEFRAIQYGSSLIE